VNFSNRPIYQRRRRVALLIVVLLILLLLLLVVLFLIGRSAGETGGEQVEQVNAPTVEQAPDIIDEQTTDEEDTE
jgi:predicted PurR-regulated permease PerM